jgi:hypothetical protein
MKIRAEGTGAREGAIRYVIQWELEEKAQEER